MGEIANRIDKIINNRQARVRDLKEVERCIENAHANICEFNRFQSEIQKELDTAVTNVGCFEGMTLVSTGGFESKYREYIQALDCLKKRLNRDRLHICFVGSAGMGKSLVMQRISGLDNSVIPSEDGGDCTGAKSIITNSESDGIKANIIFYETYELVEIINNYISAISDKACRINSVDDIPHIPLDTLKVLLDDEDDFANKRNLLNRLEKYVEHYKDYREELGHSRVVLKNDITKYVAQHDDRQDYFNYLGVKLADIHTRFPAKDVGKIVLIDTVGTGDTALGVEKDQLNTIKNDSDAIILMFKPDNRGGFRCNEQKIISAVQTALKPEYTQEMLFWVVNRDNRPGGNALAVEKTISDIRNQECKIADILDVDCFSVDEVENKLLLPVLRRISERITYADNVLIRQLNKLGEELYLEYHKICKETDHVISKSTSADLKNRFEELIDETWDVRLSGKLRTIYQEKYMPLRDMSCTVLEKAAEEKIKNIRRWVPSKDTVLEMLSHGKHDQFSVYKDCTNIMRMCIIDDFSELDATLEKLIEHMKQEVLHVFTDEDNGRLGLIVPFNCTANDWIDEFLDKVNGQENYPIIADALSKFRDYIINVQGFLIHEVREHLDCIDDSLNYAMPSLSPIGNNPDHNNTADEILIELKRQAEHILDDVSQALNDLYVVPNRSMFAAIKDLYDRITYTVDKERYDSTVEREWIHLYKDWIPFVWKERYEQESVAQRNAEYKNKVLSNVKELDKLDIFKVKE